MTTQALSIVKGSLEDMSKRSGKSIAEHFLSAKAVVLIDVSGSMGDRDAGAEKNQQRYALACRELARLQEDLPGQIAVVAFSSDVEFCPGGHPRFMSGGTNLTGGLRFVRKASEAGIPVIVISDGAPDSRNTALDEAKKFPTKIDCIFIGPSGDAGEVFLKELAAASGGVAVTQSCQNLPELSNTVQKLLGK